MWDFATITIQHELLDVNFCASFRIFIRISQSLNLNANAIIHRVFILTQKKRSSSFVIKEGLMQLFREILKWILISRRQINNFIKSRNVFLSSFLCCRFIYLFILKLYIVGKMYQRAECSKYSNSYLILISYRTTVISVTLRSRTIKNVRGFYVYRFYFLFLHFFPHPFFVRNKVEARKMWFFCHMFFFLQYKKKRK